MEDVVEWTMAVDESLHRFRLADVTTRIRERHVSDDRRGAGREIRGNDGVRRLAFAGCTVQQLDHLRTHESVGSCHEHFFLGTQLRPPCGAALAAWNELVSVYKCAVHGQASDGCGYAPCQNALYWFYMFVLLETL